MATLKTVVTVTTVRGSGFHCDACHQPITACQVECRCAGERLHQWCHYVRSLENGQSTDPKAEIA